MKSVLLSLAVAAVPLQALADAHSAEACKAALSPTGQEIYAAALAANVTPETGTAIITREVEKLMAEGKVTMSEGRAAGEAAGKCLEMLE